MSALPIQFSRELTAGNIKAAMAAAAGRSGDLWNVPRGGLYFMPGFNVRIMTQDYRDHIEQIALDMLRNGYKRTKPLSGFVAKEGDRQIIYVTDGHTRLLARDRAVELGAKIDELPVRIVQPVKDEGSNKPRYSMRRQLNIELATNNNGRPLKPVELGIVCQRLSEDGMSDKEISTELHVSVQYVDGLRRLISGPDELLRKVIEDRISAAAAIEILRRHGGAAVEIAQEAQQQAAATGKERVTPKLIRQAEKKVSKPKQDEAAGTADASATTTPNVKATSAEVEKAAPSGESPTPVSRSAVRSPPSADVAAQSSRAPSVAASTAEHVQSKDEISDAERYRHLLACVDTEIWFNGVEYQSKKELDKALDADIRATQTTGLKPAKSR